MKIPHWAGYRYVGCSSEKGKQQHYPRSELKLPRENDNYGGIQFLVHRIHMFKIFWGGSKGQDGAEK